MTCGPHFIFFYFFNNRAATWMVAKSVEEGSQDE